MNNISDIIKKITGKDYAPLSEGNFEQIITESLLIGDKSNHPSLINVSGIPGSGKTTYCNKLLALDKYKNYIYIGFDSIMENPLTPYKNEECVDAKAAFQKWELPARIAGYELLRRAVENKYSIIFEHSSSIKEHIELFKHLISQQGYEVNFVYLNIDIMTAQERADKRDRYLPTEYLTDRLNTLSKLLAEYKKICTTFKQIEICPEEL